MAPQSDYRVKVRFPNLDYPRSRASSFWKSPRWESTSSPSGSRSPKPGTAISWESS
jgi:hypothetical protein